MIDPARVDLILEYALLAAGRADEHSDRCLGPIHLIKYVYLADLAYAAKHEGETYTGVEWRFHHFGPWSKEVFQRIEPATKRLAAHELTFSSPRVADDSRMWWVRDEQTFEDTQRKLPLHVSLAVSRVVREFGHDTAGLLHFVYRTPPMLHAAPGEVLDFATALVPAAPSLETQAPSTPLTDKQKKKRAERLREGRERLKVKLAEPLRTRLIEASPPPRYEDDVFREGLAWLDSLAGEPLEPMSAELAVDDSVWKSPGRGDRHDE